MNKLKAALSVCLIFVPAGVSFADADEIITQGEEIFLARCDYCHGTGLERGGVYNLEKRYKGEVTPYIAERTNLTPEYIRLIVRTHTRGMAPIRYTEITDEELDWLIAYLTRNNP